MFYYQLRYCTLQVGHNIADAKVILIFASDYLYFKYFFLFVKAFLRILLSVF